MQAQSELVEGYSLQGYLIDKKTATEQKVTDLTQLKDPKVASLFDINGDGKADLYGCEPGWGCERGIVHHLEAYGLNDTIAQQQGSYFAIIPDAIERIKAGKPTLYYTWTPLWVSAVLRPGEEVSWLTVPKDPTADDAATAAATVEGIGNMGFPKNTQHVVANTEFLEENPAAKAWFNQIKIPLDDINAQNLKMSRGRRPRPTSSATRTSGSRRTSSSGTRGLPNPARPRPDPSGRPAPGRPACCHDVRSSDRRQELPLTGRHQRPRGCCT